ncbi:unnamed protein product [Vitrella brassicaformis CCMP3155]|uniref:Uncharacterized protein n=2 Tax=Vitrella brassicaformis TaxID=1169539 RepID=A0A0G4H6R5_VITBC|nr:unnamed protein product [Vitrella brassicaformis CCMP3155]|mmetsp:Transcript_38336/g.96034  ORF Transcript_38336/g.96034 Transcript_38336/m.96034 type:complete len:251 (+) Transcript_38336:98-850(+)|eukprot:CEM39376.1 unnamed protein product [Vitrella brassicaformis CCMP3155]
MTDPPSTTDTTTNQQTNANQYNDEELARHLQQEEFMGVATDRHQHVPSAGGIAMGHMPGSSAPTAMTGGPQPTVVGQPVGFGPTGMAMGNYGGPPGTMGVIAVSALTPAEGKVLLAYQLSRTVMCLSVLDLLICVTWAMNRSFRWFLLLTPFALCGLIAGWTYNRIFVWGYLGYLCFSIAARIAVAILLIANYSGGWLTALLYFLFVLIEIWVMRLVNKYRLLLTELTPEDIANLKAGRITPPARQLVFF